MTTSMQVLDHAPHTWWLLGDGERRFLDVRCSGALADYSMLLKLTDSEQQQIAQDGHAGCDALATRVQANPQTYVSRDVTAAHGAAVTAAVTAWRGG